MIGSITGTARGPRLVSTPSGVGYVVNCIVPLHSGDEVDLLVTTIVREDAITLYGFGSEGEQLLFEALVKVTGVGPALAMAILSDVGVGPTVKAIKSKDAKTLAKAKGLGVKRAEVLCSSIKLSTELLNLEEDSLSDDVTLKVVAALNALGYAEKDALAAAKVGLEKSPDLSTAIRGALGYLRSNEVGA